ncbi:hypothetical protein FLA105534_04696 [Flavobacterium bizetiae]|uniref:Uncharacterized protein n=2 Tax=Flavobacterium bizetiae TaxID=2704140 RepID=A0A6J4GZ76_9FLAO|nr:hypothetical protein FLA105534_04696 [Flavobacterium bizetiae]CAD5344362.1 hypothetical protein FLA105535_04368 [Flavobacterium bizetiae]CAD5350414.1 hypothetical protein FLA105534_04404 [Flavobacterium bizetiae]
MYTGTKCPKIQHSVKLFLIHINTKSNMMNNLKLLVKISVCSLILILFGSCSSSDENDSNSNEDLFLKINISGTTFNSEGLYATGFGSQDNCSNTGDLFLQYVGEVENSALYVEVSLAHFENLDDYANAQKNNILTTRITDTNSVWTFSTDGIDSDFCNLNNDLSIVYEDKKTNTYLNLKPNSQSTHKITKVDFVSEDSQSKFYIIEGNFTCTFINKNTDVPVSGNYRIKIEVLK